MSAPSVPAAPQAATAAPGAAGMMTLQITVPTPGPSLSKARRPKYVSASTKSLVLMVDGANYKSVDISSGTTSVSILVPFLSHSLAVNLYDDTTANSNGTLLSTGCLATFNGSPLTNGSAVYSATGVTGCDSVTFVAGVANTATAALRGVVSSAQLAFSGAVSAAGATTANLTVTALDNDDNIIATDATHPFANSISLATGTGCTGTVPSTLTTNPGVTYALTVPSGQFTCTVTATIGGASYNSNLVNNATLVASGLKVYVSSDLDHTIVTVLVDPSNAGALLIGSTFVLPAGTSPRGIANDTHGPTPDSEDPIWVANTASGSFGNPDIDGPGDDRIAGCHGGNCQTTAASPYISTISSVSGTPFAVHTSIDQNELMMVSTGGAKLAGTQNVSITATTCNAAVDLNSGSYVLYATDCGSTINWAKTTSSGTFASGLSGITGLAHDPTNHRLFVATGTAITVFDISGTVGTVTALSPTISLTSATGYHPVDGGSGRSMRAVYNASGVSDLAWANGATTVGICLGYVVSTGCASSLSWNVGAAPVRVEFDSAHHFIYAVTYDGKLHIYNTVGAPTGSASVTDTGSISIGTSAFGVTF